MKLTPDGTGYLMSAENPNDPSRFFMLNDRQAKRCDEDIARIVVDLWEHNVAVDSLQRQRKSLEVEVDNWESRDAELTARVAQASAKYWAPKSWTLWLEDDLRAERDALNLEAVPLVAREEELDRHADRLNERRDVLNHRHQLLGSPPRPETRPEWAYAMLPPTQPVHDYPADVDVAIANGYEPPLPDYNQVAQAQPQQTSAPTVTSPTSSNRHSDAFDDLL